MSGLAMRIIKQFHDDQYLKDIGRKNADDFWYWGLGDDGELYFRASQFSANLWLKYAGWNMSVPMKLITMCRIVEQFSPTLKMKVFW